MSHGRTSWAPVHVCLGYPADMGERTKQRVEDREQYERPIAEADGPDDR